MNMFWTIWTCFLDVFIEEFKKVTIQIFNLQESLYQTDPLPP